MIASFIIINYNCYDYVKRLIESKHKVLFNLKDEVIIIDNNSKGSEVENLLKLNIDVKLYALKENIGFSRANNLAVEKANAEYIVFVNPDVIFTEDCISPIIDFVRKNENAGACGPMLLNQDLSIQNSAGFRMGLLYEIVEAFFLADLLRKIYSFRFRRAGKFKTPCEVGWVSAAILVIRKNVFEEIGGFDSDFFLNYEDIDLCRRLQDKGFKNYYFPFLKSIHYSHQSFGENYELLVTSRYRSRRVFAKKYYNTLSRSFVWLIHVVGILIRLLAVYFVYSGIERKQRNDGYKKAFKLYFHAFS